MKINILGTKYDFIETTEKENDNLKGCDGYCNYYSKYILVEKNIFADDEKATDIDKQNRIKYIKRHEILHAFMCESGMRNSSINEEWAIDLLATQLPKIIEIFKQLDCIDI